MHARLPILQRGNARNPEPPDPREPEELAAAVERMGLAHVVITVVNRDDLPDGGADHYKRCVASGSRAVAARDDRTVVERLGRRRSGAANICWTAFRWPCSRTTSNACRGSIGMVRDPRASFAQSLNVLRRAKELRPDLWTKSSIMVGLGETDDEVTDAMRRLRGADVDMLTLGQYLAPGRPGERFLPVDRFVPPEQFDAWADEARAMGFRAVASGPLVRSSYRAGLLLEAGRSRAGFES